jgi:hypothetical protein
LARHHFDTTALHTDDAGAALLVRHLGLEFDEVIISLNDLDGADPDWWMQGKILTYSQQREPFVHIDSDVYLFKPLPQRLITAPVLAQNPEPIHPADPCYDVEGCEIAIRARGDGHIPAEWSWYRTFVPEQRAACTGIFGGNRLDFIREYAGTALRLLESSANRRAFDTPGLKPRLVPFFEQYILAACAAYHKVEIEYLFNSYGHAVSAASDSGFTHLMADAKRDGRLAARLEQRVARDWPEAYDRLEALFETRSRYLPNERSRACQTSG